MDLGIAGRVAVVCASTSGLGEATARALGAEGARVVVSGRRGDRAREIAAELPEAIGVEVDLTSPDGPNRLLATATEAYAQVDILVLNGPGPRPAGATEITQDDITAAVDALVRPQQRLVAAVLPAMRERRWGRILAIASTSVVTPIPTLALSNIGRSALAAYLKTLAGDVAADGVTVNLLLPGRIATDRLQQLDAATAERSGRGVDDVQAEVTATIPAGRYGRPDEFGGVAAFLCSELASYVTGVALRCDGGLVGSL